MCPAHSGVDYPRDGGAHFTYLVFFLVLARKHWFYHDCSRGVDDRKAAHKSYLGLPASYNNDLNISAYNQAAYSSPYHVFHQYMEHFRILLFYFNELFDGWLQMCPTSLLHLSHLFNVTALRFSTVSLKMNTSAESSTLNDYLHISAVNLIMRESILKMICY